MQPVGVGCLFSVVGNRLGVGLKRFECAAPDMCVPVFAYSFARYFVGSGFQRLGGGVNKRGV